VNNLKAGSTRLINELVQLSTEDLCKPVSPPPHCPRLKLLPACQFVHNRYGPMIAPQLLCHPIRWNPPEVTVNDSVVSSVGWLQVSLSQLKSRLSKVEPGATKACCHLYLSPELPPKSKTGKCVITERSRSHSIVLFSL
jgi:hypothetical protein